MHFKKVCDMLTMSMRSRKPLVCEGEKLSAAQFGTARPNLQ